MCSKPGKGRHSTSHYASHVSKIKSFLPVAAETSLTKVWTDGRTRWLQYSPQSMSGGIIFRRVVRQRGQQKETTFLVSGTREMDC